MKITPFCYCLTSFILMFSCSSPPLKNQDQLEKERYFANNIKVRKMYSTECMNGKPIESAENLINEVYFDLNGNEKCVYVFKNNKRELSKICQYDKNDNKITETWLGRKEFLKWQYYKLLYTYDSLNRLESMRLFDAIGTLYFGYIYNYDTQGRIICDIRVDTNYNATGADSLLYSYDSRDAFEKRSYSVSDSGEVNLDQYVSYKYDKNRHLIEEKWFSAENKLWSLKTNYYNADGLLIKAINWDVNTNQPETVYRYEYVKYKVIN